MENYENSEVGGISQGGVNPGAGLIDSDFTQKLKVAVKRNDDAYSRQNREKALPVFLFPENARQHQKIREKMQMRNQTLHPLVIGPEAAVRIRSQKSGKN